MSFSRGFFVSYTILYFYEHNVLKGPFNMLTHIGALFEVVSKELK